MALLDRKMANWSSLNSHWCKAKGKKWFNSYESTVCWFQPSQITVFGKPGMKLSTKIEASRLHRSRKSFAKVSAA